MTDAASLRSYQRQRFLERMRGEIIRLEDDQGNRKDFEYVLISVCLDYLEMGKNPQMPTSSAGKFFYEVFLPRLREFSRAAEETNTLVAELLEWLVKSITSNFHSALLSREILEPQVILHAPSMSAEVPFTEEE